MGLFFANSAMFPSGRQLRRQGFRSTSRNASLLLYASPSGQSCYPNTKTNSCAYLAFLRISYPRNSCALLSFLTFLETNCYLRSNPIACVFVFAFTLFRLFRVCLKSCGLSPLVNIYNNADAAKVTYGFGYYWKTPRPSRLFQKGRASLLISRPSRGGKCKNWGEANSGIRFN